MEDFITLPKPLDIRMALGEALAKRRTVRDCSPDALPEDALSTLLWACGGITADDGRRTVPSTLDLRAVSVWILRADGAWLYDPALNRLVRTSKTDCRRVSTAYQFDYVEKAPVTIVFAADHNRAKAARPTAVYVDAGTMGQSVFLAATALGLAGCIRASFDHDLLAEAMHLPEGFEPVLLFTVGLPAKEAADCP